MGQGSSKKEKNYIKPINLISDENETLEIIQKIIDLCDLKIYDFEKILKKQSESSSSQIIGRLKERNIFIKLSFGPFKPSYDNSLTLEAAIYSCVVPNLMKNNTPFLLQFYGYQECPKFIEELIKISGPFLRISKVAINNRFNKICDLYTMNDYNSILFNANKCQKQIKDLIDITKDFDKTLFYLEDIIKITKRLDNISKGYVRIEDINKELEDFKLILKDSLTRSKIVSNDINAAQLLINLLNVHRNLKGIDQDFEKRTIQLLVLKQVVEPRITLEDWLAGDKIHSIQDYKSVLFQVFWTLHCFYKIGLRHNDLHLVNIWIVEQPLEYNRFVIKNGKTTIEFDVPIRYKVLIYDFDRSTLVGKTFNKTMEDLACKGGFGCNNVNHGYDSYKFMCSFKTYFDSHISGDKEETNQFIFQLENVYLKIIKDVPNFKIPEAKVVNKSCFPPTKSIIKKGGSDEEKFNFINEELIIQYHLDEILSSDPFFNIFRNNTIINNNSIKIYHEPNFSEKQIMINSIKEYFPEAIDPYYIKNKQEKSTKILLNV